MKRFLIVSSLVAGLTMPVFGQTIYKSPAEERNIQNQTPYPMAGSERLRKEGDRLIPLLKEYARTHPESQSLEKTAAWNFTVGQSHTWWAIDMSGIMDADYQVPATCRAVGAHCYIFVEDASWSTRVTQPAVDSVMAAFDLRTPADPTKGIYELDTQYYGNPPDVDGDPKIIILILDIKDGFTGTGGYIAGYFWQVNEWTDQQAQTQEGRRSNHAEIYYVDCNPANLLSTSGMTDAASTTAHEFQHMIHYNYDTDGSQIAFMNEGLSEAAEKLCGYGLRSPSLYYANTDVPFIGWNSSNSLPEYSRAALFTWYMMEQFGTQIAKNVGQSPYTGTVGYNDGLTKSGTSLQFLDVLTNFAIATGLNDTTVSSAYGFKQVNITTFPAAYRTFANPNVPVTKDSVLGYGTEYFTFTSGDSLSVTFSPIPPQTTTPITIHAIATGSAGKKVSSVALNTPYVENDFGTAYNKVTLVVTNTFNAKTKFQYTATGGTGNGQLPSEIAYDDGNPEGYFTWVSGDSAAVQFDAAPGAVLDSIRVAFRRSGSLSYGIWKYSGVSNPSPLAQNYGTGTMVCTDSTPPYPYPKPYQNWVKTDVSGWHVDLNNPFVVAFAFGDNPTAPGLMMSQEPFDSSPHSFTYFDGNSENYKWYIVTTNIAGDSAARYLVRAYIHYGTSDIASPIELAPKSFSLAQNYPNPFNPQTVIHYTIPIKNPVRLVVYDLLGREVATLVDQVQVPGSYDVKWDGTNGLGQSAGSGVYFYRLQSGSFTKTYKMILLR